MPSFPSNTYLFNLILLFVFYVLVLRVMVLNTTFNNTSVAVSFIGGAVNRRNPPTCRKSLTHFINFISSTPRHEQDCLLWKERWSSIPSMSTKRTIIKGHKSVLKAMFGSSLPPVVVGGIMSYLRYLCIDVSNTYLLYE
jgi:hypothetical protein